MRAEADLDQQFARAKELMSEGRLREAVQAIEAYEGTPARDVLLCTALLRLAGETDAAEAERLARRACEVALQRFLLLQGEIGEMRSRVLELLMEAAERVDRDLVNVLHGGEAGQGKTPSWRVSAAVYLGGATATKRTDGERAMVALDQLKATPGRAINTDEYCIEIMKQYSSFTPLLKPAVDGSVGGGYFARLGGYGCVIDPGHHFWDNFLAEGRTIDDIDGVIVTHFHDDHYADLPALLSLLHQRHKKDPTRRVDVFADRETLRRFGRLLRKTRNGVFRRVQVLRGNERRRYRLNPDVTLRALPTRHDVFGKHSGVGLHFDLEARGTHLVITGDTAWHRPLESVYRTFEGKDIVLIAHVSSVSCTEAAGELLGNGMGGFYRNHLCVRGLCKVIECTRPRVVILSEIGEELRDVIDRLADLVKQAYRLEDVRVARRGLRCPL